MKFFFIRRNIKIGFVLLLIVTACFVIDSFAPANPKCYHKWVLSTFNGSYDVKGNPKTYWEPEQFVDEETGIPAISFIVVDTTVTNNDGVNEIWLNLSDFKEYSTTILIRQGAGLAGVRELKQYQLTAKALKKDGDGWVKIYDTDLGDKKYEGNNYSKTFSIGFATDIRVREIAFVGNNNSEVKFENVYMMRDKDKVTGDGEYDCKKLTDEQSTFPYGAKQE